VSLVTRCPACGTAFRVQPAQLSARGGKVRCGKCRSVFDGIAGLMEERTELLSLEPSPQLGLFDPSRRPAPAPEPPTYEAEGDEDVPVPEFLLREERRTRPWLWGTLAFLAAAALLGQAAYRYRTELAILFPQARPALEEACRLARCEVPLPRRPDLVGIESSDLQAVPGSDSLIVLNAVLRNRAPFAQQYPSLELTLTDDADRPVLRRVIGPSEYLAQASPEVLRRGLPAGAETSLRMNLEPGSLAATGYRLYLFFPQ
jgi:predicted Zn finger-like uncharacterized protein